MGWVEEVLMLKFDKVPDYIMSSVNSEVAKLCGGGSSGRVKILGEEQVNVSPSACVAAVVKIQVQRSLGR